MLCGSIVYRSAASTILMYLRAARCWVALWKRCSLKPARCAFEKKISDDCSSYSSSRYVEIAAFTKSNLNPIPDPTRTNKHHSVVSIQLNIDTRPQWRRNEFESGAPVQRESGRGHRSGAGIFFSRAPPLVLPLKVQLAVLVSAFVMVSTVWSVSCLLFFYSRCPRTQSFVKVGVGATARPTYSHKFLRDSVTAPFFTIHYRSFRRRIHPGSPVH